MVNNPCANARKAGSIPGSGGSPGAGNGNPLQYSCLENSIEKPGGLQKIRHGWTWAQNTNTSVRSFLSLSVSSTIFILVESTILVCLGCMIEYYRLGSLNNRNLVLTILETGSPRSRSQQSCCLVRTHPLGCRPPPSSCVFTWPLLCAWRVREGGEKGVSSQKDANPIGSGPHLYDLISA